MSDGIKNTDIIEYIISEESKGLRADQAIAKLNNQFSRSLIQKWIKKGNVLVNGKKIKPRDIVNLDDKIKIVTELIAAALIHCISKLTNFDLISKI